MTSSIEIHAIDTIIYTWYEVDHLICFMVCRNFALSIKRTKCADGPDLTSFVEIKFEESETKTGEVADNKTKTDS